MDQAAAIDAVAFVGWCLKPFAFEDVAQVSTAFGANDLDTGHAHRFIPALFDIAGLGRIVKRGPAAAGVEFLVRGKQQGSTARAVVCAFPLVLELFVNLAIGPLGAGFTKNVILLGCQDLFPLGIGFYNFRGGFFRRGRAGFHGGSFLFTGEGKAQHGYYEGGTKQEFRVHGAGSWIHGKERDMGMIIPNLSFGLGLGPLRNDGFRMRLLHLVIREPGPGVLPKIAAEYGSREAVRRFQAIVVTTLRQLRGLEQTTIRIEPQPMDAEEALRFWLLPKLAGGWRRKGERFIADGWCIAFGDAGNAHTVAAEANVLCPMLSARWVHAALAGLDRGGRFCIGHDQRGQPYLTARASGDVPVTDVVNLPQLPSIETADDWNRALEGPLGPALFKEFEQTA